MEPLWSPEGATSGKQPQTLRPRKRLKQAKTVATGCHRLPETLHGKEGVDGSSPSEGSSRSRMVAWVAGLQVAGSGIGCPVMETIWKRGVVDWSTRAVELARLLPELEGPVGGGVGVERGAFFPGSGECFVRERLAALPLDRVDLGLLVWGESGARLRADG